MSMLKVGLVLTSAFAATAAFAGGLAAPVMEEVQIIEQANTSSSSAGLIIPLILIALIALALSKTGGGSEEVITGVGLMGDDILDTGPATDFA